MAAMTIDTWRIVLDLAALMLCGITFLYIAGKKRFRRESPAVHRDEKEIERIARKTFYHMVHHNEARAPRSTVASHRPAQRTERRSSPPKSRKARRTAVAPLYGNGAASHVTRIPKPVSFEKDGTSMKIHQFAESGMSAGKISERLEIPRCEVELISKFRTRAAEVSSLSGPMLR